MPYKSGISYGDPIAGICAAAAVATALIQRKRTGKGQYIDLAQREVMSTLLGEFFHGLVHEPSGCRSTWAPATTGWRLITSYPCAGDDDWIAICVRTDAEWEGLKRAMGSPDWPSGLSFPTRSFAGSTGLNSTSWSAPGPQA